jgi:hypothetical protein
MHTRYDIISDGDLLDAAARLAGEIPGVLTIFRQHSPSSLPPALATRPRIPYPTDITPLPEWRNGRTAGLTRRCPPRSPSSVTPERRGMAENEIRNATVAASRHDGPTKSSHVAALKWPADFS